MSSNSSILMRRERFDDAAAIYALHVAAFPTAAEARLVDLLRAANRLTISLVAEVDGQCVGHVAFSPVTTAEGAIGAGLAPLAVSDGRRRRGIAATLVRAGLDACRTENLGWCVVLGEPEYYGRFGFRRASDWGLVDEYGGGDAFQAVELISGTIPTNAGLVRYAPEFQSLS